MTRKYTDIKTWHLANLKTGKPCDFIGKKNTLKLFDLSTNVSKIIAAIQIKFN